VNRPRVGVDGTSWANPRGFGRFARSAVGRLVELDRERTYVFLIDEREAEHAELPPRAEQLRVRLRRPSSEAAAAGSSRGILDVLRLVRAARGSGVKAFLFPSLHTYFPVPGVPTIVGLHDTTAEEHPELALGSTKDQLLWSAKQRLALRTAARLFTVSAAARAALAGRFDLSAELLPVVPEAPDPIFFPRSAEEALPVLGRFGLEAGSYLLYVGGINPHKNLDTLLSAYARLVRRRGLPPLALVGQLEEDPYHSAARQVRDRIANLHLGERVRLLGYVSDFDLAALYSSATVFVTASLSEGFGLPAVEAAACGAPAVLSDLPAHRETLDGAALFFPPLDAGALSVELERIPDDEALRRTLAEQARAAVAGLTWDASAERLLELVSELAPLEARAHG
jgi:glycosyltransferase involved in cell wall biosynthesis